MKISDLLVMTRGNQSEVARMLRIDRSSLRRLMEMDESYHIVTQNDNGNYFIFTRIGYEP